MSATAPDPVVAIGEADATGEIAELYADIRATLGVPVVNLIWRHLATIPGGLPFAWQTVRPLYASGEIASQAQMLRSRLVVPDLAARDLTGLDASEQQQISMIVRSYERSNAMNLIGLSALLASINPRTAPPLPFANNASVEPEVSGTMPDAVAVAAMHEATRALVLRLHPIGGADPIMPTMYRHLSHWPGVLEQFLEVLEPLHRNGSILPAIAAANTEGLEVGAALMAQVEASRPIASAQTCTAVDAAVSHFVDRMIGKMVVIVAILRRAFPAL